MGSTKISSFLDSVIKGSIAFVLLYSLAGFLICCVTIGTNPIGIEGLVSTLLTITIGGWWMLKGRIPRLTRTQTIACGLSVANAVMLATLLTFDTRPASDSQVIHGLAEAIADGTFRTDDVSTGSYVDIFNYQMGMAYIESLIIRVFGSDFAVMKAINLIIINLTLLMTRVVARMVTTPQAARSAFLLICCYYPMLVTVGQLTNQHIAALLILVFVWLLLKRRYLAAGALLAIISFVRPIGIILLLAFLCMVACDALTRRATVKTLVIRAALFLVPYYGITYALDSAMMHARYTDAPMQTKVPYFKFHKGAGVGYDEPFVDILRFGNDLDAFNQWEKEQVKDLYLHQPVQTAGRLCKKMLQYLGWVDWKFEMTYNHDPVCYDHPLLKIALGIGWGQYVLLILLCLAGYRAYCRRNGADIIQILYLGLVLVYFFIEAWTSYRYESYPLMFIIAGAGLRALRAQGLRTLLPHRR